MVVTQAQIDAVQAQILAQPKYSAYAAYVHGDTFQVNGTQAASAAAGSPQAAAIIVDGVSSNQQQVPQSQIWIFTDLYTQNTTATANDATVTFIKNNVKTIATTAPLSTQLTTNQTRPGLPAPFYFEPNSKLTVNTLPIVANGTSIVTDTFFVAVTILDSTFS